MTWIWHVFKKAMSRECKLVSVPYSGSERESKRKGIAFPGWALPGFGKGKQKIFRGKDLPQASARFFYFIIFLKEGTKMALPIHTL